MSEGKLNVKTVIVAVILSVIISVGSFTVMKDSFIGPQGEQGIQGIEGVEGIQGVQGIPGVPAPVRGWSDSEVIHINREPLGTTDTYTSSVFMVQGTEIRLVWVIPPPDEPTLYCGLGISIMYANGTFYAGRLLTEPQKMSCDIRIRSPGEYYLEISSFALTEYTLTVWEYI